MNALSEVRQKHEPLEAIVNGAGRAFSCWEKYLGPLSLALIKGFRRDLCWYSSRAGSRDYRPSFHGASEGTALDAGGPGWAAVVAW
jgi:hypothetical protein